MTSSHPDESTKILERFGGKGVNLRRLRDAGFPVPPFVVLGTDEYAGFVVEHGLDAEIDEALGLERATAAALDAEVRSALMSLAETYDAPLEAAQ